MNLLNELAYSSKAKAIHRIVNTVLFAAILVTLVLK